MTMTAQDDGIGDGLYSALRFAGGTVALGFTGPQKFDGTQPFSISTWVRPNSTDEVGCILSRQGAFSLQLSKGVPSFSFGAGSPIEAAWALQPGDWHHLVIAYAPQTAGGLITFTIDEVSADTTLGGASIMPVDAQDTGQPLSVGGAGFSADVLSLTLYSSVAEPEDARGLGWAAPRAETPDLLAAFDFAGGTATDISGNSYSVQVQGDASLIWLWPAALFDGSTGYATPDPDDALNPGNGATPFTIMVSAYPAPTCNGSGGGMVIANQDATGSASIGLSATANGGQISWNLNYTPENGAPHNLMMTQTGVQDIAITYDGTTMTIYCTGLTPESATCGPLAAIAQPTVAIGAAPEGGQTYQNYLSGFVQRASIWSACLSAADVSDFITNSPLTDPRCVFYTEFLDANPANRVSSRPVTLTGGVSIADLAYPVPSGPSLGAAAPSPRPWHAYPRNTAAPTPSARPAMLKLAASLPAATAGAGVDDPVHEAATREHEGLIAGLQGAHQRSLRALFSRNLDAALRLQGRALPGQVSWATVGSDHVLYYEDVAEGRTEIGRITADAADPTTIWIAAVCTQCVISLFNVLLIGFIGKTVGTAILTALRTSPGIIARVQAVIAVPLTGMSFINVVKALYQGGQLGQVLMTTLAGLSWWSWAFTITSTVVSICALWLSGGAYLAVVVGQLALDLGKLITLIREAPSTTSAAMVTSDAPATMS